MKSKALFLTVVLVVITVIDQWTKFLVHTKFYWGESISIIPGFFSLTYVRNKGAAFGFLHNAPAVFREPFFMIMPLLILAVIGFFYFRLPKEERLLAGAFASIISGAIGNMIDRLRLGYVIDFLDFHWKEVYHWPAFNVADSCIVVGMGLILIHSFFLAKPAPAK